MEHLSDTYSKNTEGLILSSYEVLQNDSPSHQQSSMISQVQRSHSSFLADCTDGEYEHIPGNGSISTTSTNSDNCSSHSHQQHHQHSCDDDEEEDDEDDADEEREENKERVGGLTHEAVAGDEMFDVRAPHMEGADRFRGDEALDSLDHDEDDEEDEDNINGSLNRSYREEEDGEEEEEEEEYEEEEEDTEGQQRDHSIQSANILQQSDGLEQHPERIGCPASAISDLRAQQQFVQFPPGALLTRSEGWPSDRAHTEAGSCYPSDWHLSLPHSAHDLSGQAAAAAVDALSHTVHARREEAHHHSSIQQQRHHQLQPDLWGAEASDSSKGVVGHQAWVRAKEGVEEEIEEELDDGEEEEEESEACHSAQELQKIHHSHRSNMDGASGHWVTRQPHQGGLHHGWPKEIGEVYPGASAVGGPRGGVFLGQTGQAGMTAQVESGQTAPWSLHTQLSSGSAIRPRPGQYEIGDSICSQQQFQQQQQQQQQHVDPQPSSAFYRPRPTQVCTATMQGQGPWHHNQAPVHIQQPSVSMEADHHRHSASVVAGERFHAMSLPPHPSKGVRYKGQGRMVTSGELTPGGHGVRELQHNKARATTLTQARQHSHPYHPKDEKKMVKDVYSATSANVHTLKASHIVSWYIDYLIHENEHLTQISQAFSLPVNLFHSDDFYFMESLKKKVHFPSLKFLTWMKQNLPSINVNAVDFHEGRPSSASTSGPSAQSSTSSLGGVDGAGSLGLASNLHSANSGGKASDLSRGPLVSHWGGQLHQNQQQLQYPHHQHQHLPHHHHHYQQQQQHEQQQEVASWQNKSRRDIIHDVFFYFQHRRVTCQN